MVDRNEVVQGMLDLFEAPKYLEVGVNKGVTFKHLRAEKKVAVDPRFVFDYRQYNKENPNCEFYEMTSDAFYGSEAHRPLDYDVIYLDGLHTFDQTLRDLLNSLPLLKPNGVIVVDDVLPNSYRASLPNEADCVKLRLHSGEKDKSWMGDVYRLVFFVHSYLQQYQYATVADNHGQMVIWRGQRPTGSFQALSVREVSALPYEQTILSRELFNLKPYGEIVDTVRASLSERVPLASVSDGRPAAQRS